MVRLTWNDIYFCLTKSGKQKGVKKSVVASCEQYLFNLFSNFGHD